MISFAFSFRGVACFGAGDYLSSTTSDVSFCIGSATDSGSIVDCSVTSGALVASSTSSRDSASCPAVSFDSVAAALLTSAEAAESLQV